MVTPTEVQKKIEKVLRENPETKGFNIEVVDEGGVITLKGVVPSMEAKEEVGETVELQDGVIEVVNDLEVDSDQLESGETTPPPPIAPSG